MPLDPSDYDPDELRSAANDELGGRNLRELRERIAEHDQSVDAEDALRSSQVKELLLRESGTDPADLERPYLDSLPSAYAARLTLFEWLDFLLQRGGVRRTLEALEYYADIGWIGGPVAEELRDHVRAFDSLPEDAATKPLDVPDHVLSLVYIARLSSME